MAAHKIPLSEIVQLPEFQEMIPALRQWVRAYLVHAEQTGKYDPILATHFAYPDVKASGVVGRAAQIQVHPRVRRVLNIAFGRDDEILVETRAVLKRAVKALDSWQRYIERKQTAQ